MEEVLFFSFFFPSTCNIFGGSNTIIIEKVVYLQVSKKLRTFAAA